MSKALLKLLLVLGELCRYERAHGGHIASAHGYEEIARFQTAGHERHYIATVRQIGHLRTGVVLKNTRHEGLAADSRDRSLPAE